ncbi:MAG TPA: dihydrolipoamide acetyltransferase family protein, partial [Actinomycetota bacterium]|nr:dihydrolipoamide acetyltransferase family protein [Actinomycetota bacterium]
VEISTDKVDSEVPSSASGTLQKILVPEGETVKVGTPLAVIGEDGEAAGTEEQPRAEAEEAPEQAQAEAEPEPEQAQPGAEPEPEPSKPQEKPAEPVAAQAQEEERPPETPETRERIEPPPSSQPGAGGDRGRPGDTSKRGIISPLVRRLAEEHQVALDEVEGTGTGGRIRKQDVLRYVAAKEARPAAKPAASAEPAPEREVAPRTEEAPAAGREELVPWSNIRRRTAEHMVASHLETARAWNAVEADWTNIVQLRSQVKDAFKSREGFSLTYMPFLAKVLCDAIMQMPEVNASYDADNQANLVKHYVNMGIAVALEGGGLIVPVVKGADEKNLIGLARGINDIVTKARSKKLSPDDITGGTFTITNPGPFGSIISVPIIPKGQTAIVGFEAIQKRVVVTDDDAIAIRSMGFLSMSWDHRTIDGAEAARFLSNVRERVETTDFSSELSQYT